MANQTGVMSQRTTQMNSWTKKTGRKSLKRWWTWRDSNPRPPVCNAGWEKHQLLLLVSLTTKAIGIPASQMYRSCTDFGGHRLLTRSHFNHSVSTLGRTYSAEHSFAMTSGWPTIHELGLLLGWSSEFPDQFGFARTRSGELLSNAA